MEENSQPAANTSSIDNQQQASSAGEPVLPQVPVNPIGSIPPQPPLPQQTPAHKKSKSPLSLFLVICFLLFLIGGCGFAYTKGYLKLPTTQPTPTPSESPVPTGTGDPTAKWETYINNESKYLFKHPPDTIVSGISFSTVEIQNAKTIALQTLDEKNSKVLLVINSDQQSNKYSKNSIKNFVDDSYKDNQNNENKFFKSIINEPVPTRFLNYEAYQYSFTGNGFSTGYVTYFTNEGIIKIIIFEKNAKYIIIGYLEKIPMDQILSTFQFTDELSPSASPTIETPIVSKPAPTSKVTSPLKVEGAVPPGWMFEGQFPIELVDLDGNIIAQATAKETVAGSWQSGVAAKFTATLTFTTTATSGKIILKNDNPSGKTENAKQFIIPVAF